MTFSFRRLALLALASVAVAACNSTTTSSSSSSMVDHTTYPPSATSGSAAEAVNAHPAEVRLWEGTAPGSEGKTSPEVVNWRTEKDSVTDKEFSFPTVTNIHFPTLTPYLPAKEKATGAAVIVAPGGGHMFLTINHEGYEIASYLAQHGVAAFVLKYRLARVPGSTYKVDVEALADGQRAIRLIRSRAAEWGIDPNRVGAMGFSAGGEVVIDMVAKADKGNANAADPVERQPSRPDFQALIYPGGLRTLTVDANSPVAFLACSYDDRPDISEGLATTYLKFKAAKVPAELHVYSIGGHGFGLRHRPMEESGMWMDNFLGWLGDRGFAKKM